MKVLILFCLTGVCWLLVVPASARAVKRAFALQYRSNSNNNANKYNHKHQAVRRDEVVESLINKSSTQNKLETTLEPPQTTKASSHTGTKRPRRPNSKFLEFPEEDGTDMQHTENSNELELVENTTHSPLRKLTTKSSNRNSISSTGKKATRRPVNSKLVDYNLRPWQRKKNNGNGNNKLSNKSTNKVKYRKGVNNKVNANNKTNWNQNLNRAPKKTQRYEQLSKNRKSEGNQNNNATRSQIPQRSQTNI